MSKNTLRRAVRLSECMGCHVPAALRDGGAFIPGVLLRDDQ